LWPLPIPESNRLDKPPYGVRPWGALPVSAPA
jgi:hypothetical protein